MIRQALREMARPLRLLIPDGWHHVFHQGTEHRTIYLDDRELKKASRQAIPVLNVET